ncbi:HTH domain-containing protein, partial [Streptomyces sp. NPDC058103]
MTAPPRPDETAVRRSDVARLRGKGRTPGQIARELGVHRSTVYRDIEALDRDARRVPDQQEATPAETPATPVAPGTETPSPRPETPAPATLVLAADPELLADLADLTRTGMPTGLAIRNAVRLMAGAYRDAWAAGIYPPTARPII